MEKNKMNEELKQFTVDQLQQRANDLRQELFSLRLNALTSHVKDYSKFSKLRKDIARVLTHISKQA